MKFIKPRHPFEAKARSDLAHELHASRRLTEKRLLPKTWKCPLKRVAGVTVTRWTCGEVRVVFLIPVPGVAPTRTCFDACLPGRTTASANLLVPLTDGGRRLVRCPVPVHIVEDLCPL